MSLIESIDALLQFVGDHKDVILDGVHEQFLRLDQRVYVEAAKADLLDLLPNKDAGEAFWGRTNLPVIPMEFRSLQGGKWTCSACWNSQETNTASNRLKQNLVE